MESRALTEEEIREASRARVVELVYKLKLCTEDELTDLVSRLESEAPEVLKALKA